MITREAVIENYLQGYNSFNVAQMTRDMDPSVLFKNISGEELTLELSGLEAFKAQAEKAVDFFSERSQTIQSIKHENDTVEIEIAYAAILAQDLPNGLLKGQALQLTGTSVFTFNKDNKITSITDIS